MMPTLAQREQADQRQRAKARAIQRKQTVGVIERQMADALRKVRAIPQEEWDAAVREDQANAA